MINFMIESAARTDSGIYRIKATNQLGWCEQDINVLVIGMLSIKYIWYVAYNVSYQCVRTH